MTEIIDNQFMREDSNEDSTRKLATIITIRDIRPIEGADRIEIATFTSNSWQCVVGKGEFKVGDRAIFFEVDSFLPKEERYKVLEGRCYKTMNGKEGYRLKSARFKGEISQGFAMPFGAFPLLVPQDDGTDYTEALGIKLWQAPIVGGFGFNIGCPKGGFPTHLIKKTDQERLQFMTHRSILEIFNHTFEVTEKLDGTSCAMYVHTKQEPLHDANEPQCTIYKFGVCSRNLEMKPSGKEMVEYVRWIGGDNEPLKEGEQIVQDENVMRSEANADCIAWFKAPNKVEEDEDMDRVWSVFVSPLVEGIIQDLIAQAAGMAFTGLGHREGLVFKSMADPMKSFKVINNEFLLAQIFQYFHFWCIVAGGIVWNV